MKYANQRLINMKIGFNWENTFENVVPQLNSNEGKG